MNEADAEAEIEKFPASGEVIWDMEKSSVLLDSMVRSPRSLQIDDNNKLYIGVTDGVYIMKLKKIANRKMFTESIINVNEMFKKHFKKESLDVILNDLNKKARDGQERNYTTATMLMNKLKLGSLVESKVILKAFEISPCGLLPGNEPVIAMLLNTDMLFLAGKASKKFIQPYITLTNCDMLTQDDPHQFPILFDVRCMAWVRYVKDNVNLAFLFVHHKGILEAWVFKYFNVNSSRGDIDFKSVLKEDCPEIPGIMIGEVNPLSNSIDLVFAIPQERISKVTYEVESDRETGEMTLKRGNATHFNTPSQEVQKISILPTHLTPDDAYVRFVYCAQNQFFVAGFDEENPTECIYAHKFPTNLSELLFNEDGFEFFFMDGSNVIAKVDSNISDSKVQRKEGMYAIFGASYSSTQILKILVGPPNYFALKNTNLLILSNVSDKSAYFDIIYQMANKIIANVNCKEGADYRLYLSKKPLDFSDILLIFSTNQINYRHFLKAYFATYDETLLDSRSKKKASLKELLMGINTEIVKKFGLSAEMKNHVFRTVLLNLLYFAPEHFRESITKMLSKAILNFYTSVVLWCKEEAKDDAEIKRKMYIPRVLMYLKNEDVKQTMDIEEAAENDMCPICSVKLGAKETQCTNGHLIYRCLLSRKVIYFGDYFECRLCKQKYLKESLVNYSSCEIDLNFSCGICCNLLKQV